jgi:hypothetical protein
VGLLVQRNHNLLIRDDLGVRQQEGAGVSKNRIANWDNKVLICAFCVRENLLNDCSFTEGLL